jgi:hypothetical protein
MSEMIPERIQKQIDKMAEKYREELVEMYRWSNSIKDDDAPKAVEIEDEISNWLRRIGSETQELIIGQMDRNRRKGKRKCPECGEEKYWERYEPRNYITTLGEMQLERAYYNHGACHSGWVPLDQRLGLGASELSQRAQEMVSFLGAFMPFEQAQTYLSRYHGLHISHDTVNNATVRIGQILKEQQELAVKQTWETESLPACEVVEPPEQLYISADGIKYLLPDGSGKEIRVAAIYETEERRNRKGEIHVHAINLVYVVHSDVEQLARAAYLIARKRGVTLADQIIVLGDGANWIWNRISKLFPVNKTTEIVDFYHASEYIWNVANTAFGQESQQAQDWADARCRALKHQGPEPILQALLKLSPKNASASKALADALSYFQNQGHRMDYPIYVEMGLQIGSGSAESAVNQVVGVRLNQSGMRWNPDHAEAVSHVRAAILSGRGEQFWKDFAPHPRQYRRASLPLAA